MCWSRQASSSACSVEGAVEAGSEAAESTDDAADRDVGRVNMYFRSVMDKRKAAFTIAVNASVGRDLRYAAFLTVVDQTRVAWLSGSGRKAIGPPRPGRKR